MRDYNLKTSGKSPERKVQNEVPQENLGEKMQVRNKTRKMSEQNNSPQGPLNSELLKCSIVLLYDMGINFREIFY